MSKIIKIFTILVLVNLFVGNLKADPVPVITVRDVVNGFDNSVSRYDRIYQICEKLAMKMFQVVRAKVMADSFYSSREREPELELSDDDLEDFTFESKKSDKGNNEVKKEVKEEKTSTPSTNQQKQTKDIQSNMIPKEKA